MEPRLLYSADLTAGLLLATTSADAAPEVRTLTSSGEYATASAAPATTSPAAAAQAYASASLNFEANAGQAAAGVDFSAYGSGYGISLDGGQASLTLVTAEGQRTVTLQLQGAADNPQGEGEGLLATKSNVIVGGDPSQWATGLANYASVIYRNVYDGVDVRYYGNQRQLEYDFIVAPGADAAQVALHFDGVTAASVADNGDLVLQVADSSGEVRFRAPVSYQRAADGSMEAVASRYEVRPDGSIGFVLGEYDHSRELVIDPVLDYATYFGTSGSEDAPAVAVDASGNVYITGRTNSNASPLGSTVGSGGGGGDIYVAKFSPDLSTRLFSTRIGGTADEGADAIAIDASGNIVVTGWTKSADFPTQNANDGSRSGSQDAVLFKLNASGSLVFSTYIGGSGGTDQGNAVTVDASGNIYVTGQTTSSGLLDPVLALLFGSSDNAFVEKYSASGSLAWHKELGGGNDDAGTGIALGASGDVFVVGNTQSTNMPASTGQQSTYGGSGDGFLAHLDASGTTVYQTYIGSTETDTVTGVATDGMGKAYVVGVTHARSSVVFTTTTGAYQTSALANNADTGYLRVYDTTKTGSASLQYSTYLGGSNSDLPSGVALYGADVVVVGRANSTTDFPITADAAQSTNNGKAMYLVRLHPGGAGSADLRYGTFAFSGFVSTGNAVLQGNHVYAAGQITDSNWATTGAYDTARQGNDAFVAVFTLPNSAPVLAGVVQPASIAEDDVGNAGFLVSALVTGQITDTDTDAVPGIAVVASDTTHGSWQYTLDGTTWQSFSAPSASNALLLPADAQTRIRFVPAADYNGTVTSGLTVRAWDRTTGIAGGRANITSTGGSAAFSSASFGVNLTVTPVNDPPAVSGPVVLPSMPEDGTATLTKGQLLGNASDVDGDTLSVENLTASNGTLVNNGNGTWSFTPALNYNGTVSFTYDVNDGTVSASASATLLVTPVNDAPVAGNDSVVATRNTALTIPAATLLANDSDVENSSLTIASVASGAHGTVVLNGDGSVTFTPEANYSGPASFTYTVSDGALPSAPATVAVTVNTLPTAVNDTVTATEDTAATYTAATLLANDSDADAGDTLTIASVASGTGGTAVLNANGSVTFTPNANFNGPATFTYRATDGKGVSAAATVTVNVAPVNDPPVANPDSFTTPEDTAFTINLGDLLANDTDVEGSSLSVVSVANGPGGTVVLNGNGTVKFTPDANFNGTATFTYVVFDGNANSAPGTVTITVTPVNEPPVANNDAGVTNEDTPITFTAADLLGNDFDEEGSPLTIVSVSGTGAVLNADGSVTFTPAANFNGSTSFNYRISDGSATSNNGKVTITVNPVNDAPVAVADTLDAVSNTPTTWTATQLLGNDTDVDGDPLTIGSVSSGTGGTVVLNANGTVTFTPTAGFAGNATFSYTAKDASLSSNPATVTVRVNDVPVANADTVAATEDTAATYAASTLLGNDTDSVGNPLVIASVGNATGGTAVLNANGTVTFTPYANFNGAGSFTYTASDGTLASTSATVTVNVAPVNDAPTTSTVSLPAIAEDSGPVTITQSQLLANAGDVDGDTLSVLNVATSAGTLVANGDGTWTFTPGANYNGTVNFTYRIGDGTTTVGGNASMVVTPVNDAPATTPVSLPSVAEDSGTVTITSGDLLQNASDVEGDAMNVVGLSASTGTLVDNGNGTWSFTPAANYNGTVDFTYGVSDGTATTPGTASLVVTPVNDAPTTSAVTLTGVAEDGGPVTITQADLLAKAADVDGDALSVSGLVASTGTLVANGNGTWTWTADANYNGTVTFTYGVGDGKVTTAGTASLVVTPVNDTPTTSLVNLPDVAEDSGPVTITESQLLGNASDVENDTLSVVNLVASTGTLVANGNGTWSFTSGANDNGTVAFTYGISDGTATTGGNANLVVTPVNDAPVTAPVTLPGMAEDSGTVTITTSQLLANASDVDLDTLAVTGLAASTGTVVDNGNGTWTFTPGANYNGSIDFTYGISDGTVTTAGTASLVVTPVNDAPTTSTVNLPGAVEDSGPMTITESQLLANAADVDVDALSVVNLATSTGTLVDNGNGTWTFTPGANDNGTVDFTYGISDGTVTTSATASLVVTPVNDAPTTAPVSLPAVAEDSGPVTITQSQLLTNAGDVDGDAMSIVNLLASTGTLVENGNGTWTFTPGANYNGTVAFTYDISDGTVTTAGTASLAVTPVNDAPTTAPVSLPAVAEDSGPVTITQSQLLANAGDVDGDAMSVLNLLASTGTLVDNGNGTWTFTAGPNYNGTVAFTYGITDGTVTTAGTASLVVTPVNDAPTTSTVSLPGVAEDSGAVTITESQLLANAGDVDGDRLSVVSLAASTGTLVDNGNGTWTFTPGSNYNGTVAFTYGISDGTATTAGDAALVLTPVNDAPTTGAVTLPGMAEDGGAVTITTTQLLQNASDVEGDALSITGLAASGGTLVDNGNGTWSFTPAADFNGTVSFTYGVSDGTATTAGNASLVVAPVNDAPTTSVVTFPAMQEDGGTVTITSGQLLGNARDVDGDALSVVNLAASSGTLVDNGNGTWSFTPSANANGPVSFTYTISDGTTTTAGSAGLQVVPVNDAPTATPASLPAMAEDSGTVTITPGQLLATASDVEGNALSVTNLVASSGTLVDNGNGTWSFTPERDFNGAVTFTYRISDGAASTGSSATLVVTPVNDAPQITSGGQASVQENTVSVITVVASDVDTPVASLTYSIVGGADAALFRIDATTGALAFARAPDFESPLDANRDNIYDVVVQASDGAAVTQQAVAVHVVDVAEAAPPAPAPAPSPAVAPVPAAPVPAQVAAAPTPAAAPATPTDTRGSRTGETLQEALGPAMATPVTAFNTTEVSFANAPARVVLDADGTHLFRTVVLDRAGIDFISTQPDAQLVLARFGIDSRGDGTRLDDFQRTLRSAAFANQLDRLRESLREELDLDKSVTISVVSVSLGLSLVYVLWLIRGGVLIGSYLSALPAWRILDPLPVLSRVDEEDDDDEPLEGARRDGRDTLRGFG